MRYLSQPGAALALLATVVACTPAGASESAPRRINAWVSVVEAPAAAAVPSSSVVLGTGVSPAMVSADPQGGWRADLSGRLPLGMGGFVDADGRFHSECSGRSAQQRVLDRYLSADPTVER